MCVCISAPLCMHMLGRDSRVSAGRVTHLCMYVCIYIYRLGLTCFCRMRLAWSCRCWCWRTRWCLRTHDITSCPNHQRWSLVFNCEYWTLCCYQIITCVHVAWYYALFQSSLKVHPCLRCITNYILSMLSLHLQTIINSARMYVDNQLSRWRCIKTIFELTLAKVGCIQSVAFRAATLKAALCVYACPSLKKNTSGLDCTRSIILFNNSI